MRWLTPPPYMTLLVARAIFVAAILLLAAFAWWTVRTLWRPATTPREVWIYTRGVKQFGVGAGFCGFIAQLWTTYARSPSLTKLLVLGLVNLLLAGSTMLWAGYWWGRIMADRMGAKSASPSP